MKSPALIALLVFPLAVLAQDRGFPKPDPEKAFASLGLKILQPDGSVYRMPLEDWAGARQRVADDPEWAKWIAEKRATVDAWMARHRDRREWVGGRGHDFVSPRDGSFLVWTPDIPGEEAPKLRSRTGHDVEITPKIMGGWVDKFRKQHMEMIAEAARFYRLTDDVRYAAWVASQLDFYADGFAAGAWPVAKGHTGRLGVMPFNDGVMLTRLTEAARLVFDSPEAPAARRQAWLKKLFLPEFEFLDEASRGFHNHTLWERVAQAQVAMLYRDDSLLSRALDGEYGLHRLFEHGVTGEWFWFEQSMPYHDFVMMGMQPLLVFAGLTGQADRIRHEAAIVQNMMLATLQIRFPDNTVPNPADSAGTQRAPSGRLGSNYRTLPTTLGLAMAMAGKPSWDKLLDPPEDVARVFSDTNRPSPEAGDWQKKPAARGEATLTGKDARATSEAGGTPAPLEDLPPVVSRHFETTRFAQLRRGPWQVFFHYGQAGRPHAQGEALNWSAYFGKTRITADPGNVGYGSRLWSDYYTRGLNHNVPLADGEGQNPWHPGKLLRFDADAGVMSAAQPDYREGVSATRTLRIDGDALIDEATVTLAGSGARETRLGLALHLYGTPRPDTAFVAVPDKEFSRNRPAAFRYWKQVRSAPFRDRAAIDVEFPGGPVLRVTFSVQGGGDFTLYQGSSPDLPPRRRAGFYLELPAGRAEATVTTRLEPADTGAGSP
ncbi:heparinase [Opitutaceae bacterium TAV5]|nr:heparinase [Opitutaceae bacterium TAV5]